MNAEIISVGTELILGSTLNTNTYYLTKRLSEIGIDVLYHTAVVDNFEKMQSVLDNALDRVDLLIFTGGLGPTTDDMTKEVVSKSLNLKLELNLDIEQRIKGYFKNNNKKMPLNNRKQAYIPKGGKYLINEIGTAPGIYIEWNNKKIILLPGPPKEMKLMFDKYVIPLIKQDYYINIKTLKTIGIGESKLETELKDIIDSSMNPSIATYGKDGIVDIKIVGKGTNKNEVDILINKYIKEIENRVYKYIYSYEDESIEEIIYKELKERNWKIAFCESCTGGLLSAKFTEIPGVSQVFERGIVTYSNKSKIDELNVKPITIEKFGPVSKQVALEMAKGLIEKTGVDVALSVTGLAGPSTGDEVKPVGLVYIGIATQSSSKVIKSMFKGNRKYIQNKIYLKAFNELRKIL